MDKRINVIIDGEQTYAVLGNTLSEIIRGERPCGGHGRCGKCRVVAKGELSPPSADEKRLLTDEELERGVRLACLTRAIGDCDVITTEKEENAQIVTACTMPAIDIKPAFSGYGAAIDIGTTTLAARLWSEDGRLLASASRVNPQGSFGADVVSRIEAAIGGRDLELAAAVRGGVDGLLRDLSLVAGISTEDISGAVITGNTAMLSLLCGVNTEPLSHAPFIAESLFGSVKEACELSLESLSDHARIYFPPCISAFVGADTVSAILATDLCEKNTSMLADIGTNGEMALYHEGVLTVCSTAAGPAFEGVGITMGMRGAKGAIDKVSIDNGELRVSVIGNSEPRGICGTGLIDAVASMLTLGVIDESGYLEDDEYTLSSPVVLTPGDVRALQLAKSAIAAGLSTLIESAGISAKDVSALYIAGGFGSYLNTESACAIGLLLSALQDRSLSVGNAALAGASMLLLNIDIREKAERIAASAHLLDLAGSTAFADRFMLGMTLERLDS